MSRIKCAARFAPAVAVWVIVAAAGAQDQQQPGRTGDRRRGDFRTPDRLKVGDPAPDVTLQSLDGPQKVTLSDFRGKRPVVLVFGSYTCPPFRQHVGALDAMHQKYKDRAEFFLVYIREAHPIDGWRSGANDRAGILVEQPTTLETRADIALQMCVKLELNLPCLIDGLDNKVGEAYSAWPDRIYIVGTDGRIVYMGAQGPRGFQPDEAETALRKYLDAATDAEP